MKKKTKAKISTRKVINKANSLYVHIPFCADICSYCDFSKLIYLEKWVKQYIPALIFELNEYNISKVKTIYVGGGTPTCLNDKDFDYILGILVTHLKDKYEFTIEANIESLTENKLKIMKKYGVNRLSIGVQSSNDEILMKMSRHYTFEQAKKVIKLARQYINNINVDLIYAYPTQTKAMLMKDLKSFVSLKADHISTYSLTIDCSTKYYLEGYREANQDIQREFYDCILKYLRLHGYQRYEVSNFAKKNKYSRHNLTYWKNRHYYAIGLGASGYLGNIRYQNTKNINDYIMKKYISDEEKINKSDFKEYYLITNLRLSEGFSIKDYIRRFNVNPLIEYKDELKKLKKEDLIFYNNDRIKATDNGIMLLDYILIKLMKA